MRCLTVCLTVVAVLAVAGVSSAGNMYVDENPASFSSVTPYGGDLTLAMWDLQFSYDLTAITGLAGNAGAEFDGTYFYSGRWASDLFHEIDLAFTLVREFAIPGVAGIRDLAYDGTYFYGGASGSIIYEMDFATSTLVSSVSNAGLSVRAIAYNGDNDTFYSSNWADPVNESDRAGNIVSTFNLVTTTSTYGMAYESHCTGVGYLWVFDQTAGGAMFHQWDVGAGAYTGVTHDVAADFPATSGIAGGAWFYAGYLPDTGTLGGLLQGVPDMGFGYELCGPPPSVTPPEDLVCMVTVDNDVDLTWTNTMTYDDVNVYRDDNLIATLPGDAEAYLDIAPGVGPHTYGVSGVVGGDESGQATCGVTIFPGGGQVCYDFNSSDGGWVAGGFADWQWGDPSFVIDGKAWETNLMANYFNNSCGWIDSPTMDLGNEGGWLTFDSWDNVEASWDGWNVQVSLDGGGSWAVIFPVDGYDQGIPNGACDEGLDGDTFAGQSVQRSHNFDLTGYPNTSVNIRIIHQSDGSVARTGVVIDNVCMMGGSIPSVLVQCQLLNPDMDGDGIRDVHVGEYMYYSATFVNMTMDEIGYGAEHFFYAMRTCADAGYPFSHFGPACKGTLEGGGVYTHYYRVMVPNNNNLIQLNPFAVEIAAWECVGGQLVNETSRCCFDVIVLPGWEPPPVPGTYTGFVVEEVSGPPPMMK